MDISVANAEQRPLPGPEDRPAADLVLYDGDCSFCIGQVRRLGRWDTGGRLAFLPRKDPRVESLAPGLAGDDVEEQMYVVSQNGAAYGGARALRYLSRRLPRLWWAAPVLHLPGTLPLWSWLYRQVAKRRHRWSGASACEDGTCRL